MEQNVAEKLTLLVINDMINLAHIVSSHFPKGAIMTIETEYQLHVVSDMGGRAICACVLSGFTKAAAEEATRQLSRGGFLHSNSVTILDTGRPFTCVSPPSMFGIPTRTELPGGASGGNRC